METVHFIITGEFVTERSRALWTEGYPDKAIKLLTEGLEGMTESVAIQILTGKKKLTGASVCDREDCSMPQCKEYDPVALESDNTKGLPSTEQAFALMRKKPADAAVEAQERTAASREAADRDVVGRYMGIKRYYGIPLDPSVVPPGMAEGAEKMLKAMTEPLPDTPVDPDDFTQLEGWLSPDGKWYSCEYGYHGQLAHRLLLMTGEDLRDLEAEKALDERGWMKVHNPTLTKHSSGCPFLLLHPKCKPTDDQKEAVAKWSEKYGRFVWDGNPVNYLGWLALLREG